MPWTKEWDVALMEAAVAQRDSSFDDKESLLVRQIGAEYHYHTNLRSTPAHPTRDSLEYALFLFEAGGHERRTRAERILTRMLDIQDTEPDSKWYGLWGYYLEEPASKMSPADYNWADFNGSLLLLIDFRHGHRLPEMLRSRMREGIRHAAISVRRRNVAMTYTNIAVQGTFVLLAAANVLQDAEMRAYAVARLHRFAATVDETGSFNEYNSPTYANVTLANLTRMRMFTPDKDVIGLINALHDRVWLHLGKHWHAATAQIAGPMSRCYSTDIGAPLWLQKALAGRLEFASLDEIRTKRIGAGEVAMLDYRCPVSLANLFLEPSTPHQHRELFLNAQSPAEPVQGTTWIEPAFSLGSVSRGDFWVQRRPLLAFWGDRTRPARYAQLRFIKDDYDFSSALLASVQEGPRILGLVNFRSPGGDKHISLDPIPDGKFQASRMRLRLDLAGEIRDLKANGNVATMKVGSAFLGIRVLSSMFGKHPQSTWKADHEDGLTTLSIDLLNSTAPVEVNLHDLGDAYLSFALLMQTKEITTTDLSQAFEMRVKGATGLKWGALALNGLTGVHTAPEIDAAIQARINGSAVPVTRLGA